MTPSTQGSKLKYVRCLTCWRLYYCIPSPGWPKCHDRVMVVEGE